MSRLLIFKLLLYFLIAALTVLIGGIDEVMSTPKWIKLVSSSVVAGLVAIRAFVDRSVATEMGAPVEPDPQKSTKVAVVAAVLAALCLTGCAQIGAIKLQGAYAMGEGSDQREIRGGVTFKLRDRRFVRDGKQTVALEPALWAPVALGGTTTARKATGAGSCPAGPPSCGLVVDARRSPTLSPAEPDCAGGGR